MIFWLEFSSQSLDARLYLPSKFYTLLFRATYETRHSLGHFNAMSIRVRSLTCNRQNLNTNSLVQISFCFLVYPSLVLAYLGQGAALISNGEYVLSNIFYNSIPGPQGGALYWCALIFQFRPHNRLRFSYQDCVRCCNPCNYYRISSDDHWHFQSHSANS